MKLPRFSLRTLFVLVALASLPMGWAPTNSIGFASGTSSVIDLSISNGLDPS